ncbi:hypothetical protein GGU11DRAFT_6009 [Lentinula aff. detonsa]|nr:hypothetical protein GGU11DRAFT_6009 [Lentinula aff. detonsa]
MSTTPQSFSDFSPSDVQSPLHLNPLELLAHVAADSQRLDIPLTIPDTNPNALELRTPVRSSKRRGARRSTSLSPSDSDSTASSRSSMSPTPTLVDRSDGSPVSWKARKACHRSPKVTEAQKCARVAKEPRRKEVLARALRIKTVENSPVNEQQYRVLRMVYDEITKYPKDNWIAIVAVVIHRSFAQVKHWFSNERQKNKSGETIDWHNELGEKIRVRPMAIELCEQWSDEFFENVVMVYNFKSFKLLHWVE